MGLEISGTCVNVLPLEKGISKGGKEWSKLSFLLEYGDQYKKTVCLTLWGDKTKNLPAIGDYLTCGINPESREYNGKYYTEIQVWKIEGFTGNMKRQVQGSAPTQDTFDTPSSTIDDGNELPF